MEKNARPLNQTCHTSLYFFVLFLYYITLLEDCHTLWPNQCHYRLRAGRQTFIFVWRCQCGTFLILQRYCRRNFLRVILESDTRCSRVYTTARSTCWNKTAHCFWIFGFIFYMPFQLHVYFCWICCFNGVSWFSLIHFGQICFRQSRWSTTNRVYSYILLEASVLGCYITK